ATANAGNRDATAQLGPRARGIAVIDERVSDAALDEMDRGGIRGVRLNLATAGVTAPAAARQRFDAAAGRIASRRWHIQINTQPSIIEALRNQVMASPVPVVFDHFGGANAALGPRQPGFVALLDLVRAGKAYVKISGAYRSSTAAPDYADVTPLAKALIAA